MTVRVAVLVGEVVEVRERVVVPLEGELLGDLESVGEMDCVEVGETVEEWEGEEEVEGEAESENTEGVI